MAQAIGAVLHDPERAVFRAVIGATESRPIVLSDATSLIGGKPRAGLSAAFDAGAVARMLSAAGVTDPYDNRIHVVALKRAHRPGLPRMKTINVTVNGKAVTASVEPRTHLADFLRDTFNLTGTHLGCEHGVCGACTLFIDGVPARSCITLAVACDGASITTIEGFDDDEIMRTLREAFSREHGLQCGYCTPGMLASARDIVMRMPDASEHDIRVAIERQPVPLHRLCRYRTRDPERHRRAQGQGLVVAGRCDDCARTRRLGPCEADDGKRRTRYANCVSGDHARATRYRATARGGKPDRHSRYGQTANDAAAILQRRA